MESMRSERAEAAGSTRLTWGAWLWASSLQFFVAQVVVALRWDVPYRIAARYISDLGNTACAAYPPGSTTLVCSPWHAGMNASFGVLGVTMATGAALVTEGYRPGWRRVAGLGLVAIAGVGVLLVGLYPENERIAAHTLGAGLNFVCGNLGMILLGWAGLAGAGRRRWDAFAATMGALGLLGTALFVSGNFLGLGQGGMERVAAYPLTIWLTLTGLAMRRRYP